ncbi:MAG TPA: DUF3267 domain-containing protein, partial [Candidatus Dormibacteraeota bacterium]|nr:DUF3267 domain-containing protein [Candidatus Dormibacteraeota bacterium]
MTGGIAARLGPLGLVLFAVSVAAYAAVARQALVTAPIPYLATIVTVLLVLVLHEALHGAGFLVFGGRPKFGAGIKGGAPYLFAVCPGKRFSRGRFLVIGLLPLVGIDAGALALAGYVPLVVPAMVAFAFNTAGAVGDLWMIAVILQTPNTATFEDSAEPALIAWPGPETIRPARPPRGLDPRGGESAVVWISVAAVTFLAVFVVIGFVDVSLARASASGVLTIGNIQLASVTTAGGHVSARANLTAQAVPAAILTVP